ncbi:MAG: TRAP transporter substrate-binding protein DctP [Halobacteriovoraceae bacterium]|nr:TRAP transporter substrate-binding protein DctP [Halobacteriovoraceae bacterium]
MKVFTLLVFLLSLNAQAVTLKLAFLAPEGTTWANSLQNMANEIDEKTSGRVKFKLYFGGVSGDEPDVLRKIRAGQMHGGIFTGKTLGDIYSNARVFEIPFTFTNHQDKAPTILNSLFTDFQNGFEKNGFHSLGIYEIGHVYFVSTKEIKDLDSLKGLKIWIWEGDKIVEAVLKELNLVSVPLALPDVLSSLSTGIIQAAYAPPLGITALQWHTKIKYIVDYPMAYSIGSLLISKKTWKKIGKSDQELISKISQEYIDKANIQTAQENKETLAQFKELGIKFINFPDSDYKKSSQIRANVVDKLQGKFFSKKILSKFGKLVEKL